MLNIIEFVTENVLLNLKFEVFLFFWLAASQVTSKKFSRSQLCEILKDCKGKSLEEKYLFLEEKLMKITNCPEEKKNVLSHSLKFFKSDYKKKWIKASYQDERFIKNNENWLSSSIELPYWPVKPTTTLKPGRPSKAFKELSDCSKRRKTKDLREQVSVEELTYAASVSQRTSGNNNAAKLIKYVTTTPTRATKCRKLITTAQKQLITKNLHHKRH
ncbi:unnamed protein product [Macrosiphum euphorbiae]|uniref:Uncharacterized protein n=1 Tax=Macrosiphum euphorbiae TaxID=13131 RepID=A0AAV0WA29_9HEMI|nr:unnamed protein product [Macrosiphum euphorbiae]CAI6357595.1 unnamed protein product [Macrosiphum euphorbiae]